MTALASPGPSPWMTCPGCGRLVWEPRVRKDWGVTPCCSYHTRLRALERVRLLADEGTFREIAHGVVGSDPLAFPGPPPYQEVLERAREGSGLEEAMVVGVARVGGAEAVLAVMDFGFMGGSMGWAVGERFARAAEFAIKRRIPLVSVTASGGARMQEGAVALVQMARTTQACLDLARSATPHLAILTDPTTGGVAASFAALADVAVAEPGALIGFTGPRVIEQTVGEKLPQGFQRAEFWLARGYLDGVVHRLELKAWLARALRILSPRPGVETGEGA